MHFFLILFSNLHIAHLASKNDVLRATAITTIASLSKQCSDVSAVELLTKQLFQILSGK